MPGATSSAAVNELLDEILVAAGGLERWSTVTTLAASGRISGLLSSRFPGNRLADFTMRVKVSEQHTVITGFPRDDQQGVFEHGNVRIETRNGELVDSRDDPRTAFSGLTGIRRNLRWDPLDTAYFAGYAFWNYLTAPMLLNRKDLTITRGETWLEGDEEWRRLHVQFPTKLHTHSTRQTFYIDANGLIRRHDFTAEPVGRWARAAHYSTDHQNFEGIIVPTRRRIYPLGPRGRSLTRPTLLALDMDHLEIAT